MTALLPEERAWHDFWSEGRAQGLTADEAIDYADAMEQTMLGQLRALHYALSDLWNTMRAPLAWVVFLGVPIAAVLALAAYILGAATT